MKNNYLKIALGGCIFSIVVLIIECASSLMFYVDLNQEKMSYYDGYQIQNLIVNTNGFRESQFIALKNKLTRLFIEMFTWMIFTLLLLLFMNSKAQKSMINFCDRRINILGNGGMNCKRMEVNFIVVFLTILLFTAYGNAFMRLFGKEFDTYVSEFVFYLLTFMVVLPFLIALLYNLFNLFGEKLIYAFFITFYIKATAEFFTQEDVDRKEFSKVNISEYSKEVQNYLKERHLQDKVFQEKIKADSINAALVGWGKHEHIEIYGNHGSFSDAEFESVLMHEIGHSQDYSLHKKIFALYVIKAVEFVIILHLWKNVSKEEENENLTRVGMFLMFLIVYEMYLNKYLMVFHKLTSQNAEINADLIAKKHGFGNDLGNVLYKITVQANESIDYTFLYNAFKSFHPTIVRRVEYLNSE